MPKTVVCSCGTSAAKGACPPDELAHWVANAGGPEPAAQALLQGFIGIRPEGEALRKALSAEVHSLVKIGINSADTILLLASSTEEGFACALAVKAYLEHWWNGICVKAEHIHGLQVHDALQFRREGVVNFTQRCLRAVNDFGADNVILNPTGGFKALVPYAVLVGMIKKVACRYVFEQSDALLDLPPLPVNLDRAPFETFREIFERIERETDIPRGEWEAAVPYEQRPILDPLVEHVGDRVTLSGVGLLFMDEVRTPTECVPFLSQDAWRDCLKNLAGLPHCDPFRFLDRVAKSKRALRDAEHINMGGGLRWLKPGRTTDRYLVSLEGWRLLVWRAIREDQEGPDYSKRVVVVPGNDRSRYAPFTRMEMVR